MIPKKLQAIFDAQGHATLRNFCDTTGQSYGHVLRRVQSGDIPAIDVSRADDSRSQWRLFEEPIAAWFDERENRKPVTTAGEDLPDYYDDDGEWIPEDYR